MNTVFEASVACHFITVVTDTYIRRAGDCVTVSGRDGVQGEADAVADGTDLGVGDGACSASSSGTVTAGAHVLHAKIAGKSEADVVAGGADFSVAGTVSSGGGDTVVAGACVLDA